MRELRRAAGLTLSQVGAVSGWKVPSLSNVEHGREPAASEAMVRFYEEHFAGMGMLWELYRALVAERHRRDPRVRGPRPGTGQWPQPSPDAVGYPEDQSIFEGDITIPDDMIVVAGTDFEKVWQVRNAGTLTWKDRYLTRQSANTGPDTVESPAWVPIPLTRPGASVRISIPMRAPLVREARASLSFWKMTDAEGRLFFPDEYESGLICQVVVMSCEEYCALYEPSDERPDRVELVDETTTEPPTMIRNTSFVKTWRLRNAGTAIWINRWLERIGPPAGPATARSPRRVRIPDASPGEVVEIEVPMQASDNEGTSLSVWRMTDDTGNPSSSSPPLTFRLMVERDDLPN